MQGNLDITDAIKLVEQIILRQAITDERAQGVKDISMFARFQVNWRTTLFSANSTQRLWDQMTEEEFDLDIVLAMVSEFIARSGMIFNNAGHISPQLYNDLAKSLSWPLASTTLPAEYSSQSTGKTEDYVTAISTNPWATFLYLASMSDIVQMLLAVWPPSAPPPPDRG